MEELSRYISESSFTDYQTIYEEIFSIITIGGNIHTIKSAYNNLGISGITLYRRHLLNGYVY